MLYLFNDRVTKINIAVKTQILNSKIFIPQPSPNLVSRQRLMDLLNKGLNCKLSLISAPAGYGKTTLLSNWIEQQQLPCAWISLDEKDNDPARFFTYLIAGLQSIQLEVDDKLISTFQELNTDINEAFLLPFINQISEANDQNVLVLDDYHLIQNQAIHTAMLFLLDHLPRNIRLLIATRSDPPLQLAKMRAQSELVEIRVNDLRFTAGEAVNFLNQRMGLDLSTEDISILTQKTEGWVVGLQLAGITLQKLLDKHAFVITFAGDDRYIADYLLDEALHQQPSQIQTFLYQTSILDQFNAQLCDVVTGRVDSQAILTEIESANLFLIPLDNQRNWYRYHHLFADLLQHRLHHASNSNQIASLHHLASDWFGTNHFLYEAISHAISANDMERVVQLVETNVFLLLDRGEISTLLHWLEKIPDEVKNVHPWIGIAEAWVLVYAGKLQIGEEVLQSAERSLNKLAEEDTIRATGYISVIRAYTLWMKGQGEKAKSFACKALELLPDKELSVRAFTAYTLGGALIQCSDLENASKPLQDSITWARMAGNDHVYLLAAGTFANLLMLQGKLLQTERVCLDVLEHFGREKIRESQAIAHIYEMIAEVYLARNELDRALGFAQKSLEISKYWGQLDSLISSCVNLIHILISQRKFDEAVSVLTLANNPRAQESSWVRKTIKKTEAMIDFFAGNIPAAAKWIEESGFDLEKDLHQTDWAVYRAIAAILMAQNKFTEASHILDQLIAKAESSGAKGYLLTTLPMLSVVQMGLGNKDQALKILQKALVMAEPEGLVREYVRLGEPMANLLRLAIKRNIQPKFAAELLQAIQQDQNQDQTSGKLIKQTGEGQIFDSPESLSQRELEVLVLIAGGCTNQEIAQELYLSLYTVKSHARNIFGKLGVKNRTEAVATARLFGLLPQD